MSLYTEFLSHDDRVVHKWTQYFPVYERLLNRYVDQSIFLLEIGVSLGGSLLLWKKYLGPRALIVGIDVEEPIKEVAEDQIHIRIGSQTDKDFLANVIAEFGVPDVVIDDGSHVMKHVNTTFEYLYPKIHRNGIYIVEDMHTAYWEGWGGGLRKEGTFIENSKGLIDQLNGKYWENEDNFIQKHTFGISFFDSMVVFERGGFPGGKHSLHKGKTRLKLKNSK